MATDDAELVLGFSRVSGKVIVHLHGALIADTASQLSDRLLDVIDGQGNLQLVLDAQRMTGIDSAGLAVLVDAQRRINRRGGSLILSGPPGAVKLLVGAAGLDDLLTITPAWAHPTHGPWSDPAGTLHSTRQRKPT